VQLDNRLLVLLINVLSKNQYKHNSQLKLLKLRPNGAIQIYYYYIFILLLLLQKNNKNKIKNKILS